MELFTPELGLVFWMFVVFAILFASCKIRLAVYNPQHR